MPIVSWHRAQKLRASGLLTPGGSGTPQTQHVAGQHEQIHERQAAVAAHQHFIFPDPQPLGRQLPSLGNTIQPPVTARIAAIGQTIVPIENPIERRRQLQLRNTRFATSQIQIETTRLKFPVLALELPQPHQQLTLAVRLQMHPPPHK